MISRPFKISKLAQVRNNSWSYPLVFVARYSSRHDANSERSIMFAPGRIALALRITPNILEFFFPFVYFPAISLTAASD
jgi:hypothetical protein